PDYQIEVNGCPPVLPVGSACQVQFHFAPLSIGPKQATMVMNITGTTPVNVPITGYGDFILSLQHPARPHRGTVTSPNETAIAYRAITVATPGYDGPVLLSCENVPADTVCRLEQRVVHAAEGVTVGIELVARRRAGRLTTSRSREVIVR